MDIMALVFKKKYTILRLSIIIFLIMCLFKLVFAWLKYSGCVSSVFIGIREFGRL